MGAILARYRAVSVGDILLIGFRRLWPREGALTLVLLLFVMLSAVWSVEAAGWVDRLPSLAMICFAGTAMGFVLAKTRLRWYWTHPVALLYGLYVVFGQVSNLIDRPELHERLVDLIIRLNAWGYAARTGAYNTDSLVFVFWLAALTWIIAYVSTWLVFRLHRIWLSILPTGVAILMNLRYAPPVAATWFFFFLIFALLLLVRFNVFRQHEQWKARHVQMSEGIGYTSLPELTAYSFLIALVVWLAPTGGVTPLVSDVWNAVTGPYNDLSIEFNRLFANLNTTQEGPATTFSRALILKGPIKLGTSVLMYVQADDPVYLRATAYDVYTGKGFVTGDKLTVNFPPGGDNPPSVKDYKSRKELTQKITLRATPGNAILAAGTPLRASQRSVAEVDKPVSYYVSLEDTSTDGSLPPDLKLLVPSLRQSFLKLREDFRLGSTPSDLPTDAMKDFPVDLKVTSYLGREGRVTGLEVQRVSPYAPDFTSVRVPGRGRAPTQYSVVSSVSNSSEDELRKSSVEYPGWINERYQQLPPNVPDRIRRLARQITADATNPYDKAVKIQDYLRAFRYNEQIEPPPPTVDPLDYFLFTTREGYCDYFSTAMVVMLRSLGIPSRIAAGYFTGEFDSNKGYYLVRESNTHAWPEVYFTDYGWIDLEPTPSRPALARGAGTPDSDTSSAGPSSGGSDSPIDDSGLLEDEFGLGGGSGLLADEGPPVLQIGLVAIVIASVGGLWIAWREGLSGLNGAPLVYEQVCRLASIGFRARRSAETPSEYGRELGKVIPNRVRQVERVMAGYTRERYSRTGLDFAEGLRLRRTWQELRLALVRLAVLRPVRAFWSRRPHRSRRP